MLELLCSPGLFQVRCLLIATHWYACTGVRVSPAKFFFA